LAERKPIDLDDIDWGSRVVADLRDSCEQAFYLAKGSFPFKRSMSSVLLYVRRKCAIERFLCVQRTLHIVERLKSIEIPLLHFII
jgi:hypothetical protein